MCGFCLIKPKSLYGSDLVELTFLWERLSRIGVIVFIDSMGVIHGPPKLIMQLATANAA